MSDELITKLEAAQGPSRELDAEIALTSGLYVKERRGHDRQEWFYPVGCKNKYSRRTLHWGSTGRTLESYTSSIDAALTLVPGGWVVTLISQSAHNRQNWCCRLTNLGEGNIARGGAQEFARTPALAICIAALRARGEE